MNYAKRQVGNKVYGGQSSHLPLKLNIVVAIASAVAVCLVIEAVRAPRGPSGAHGV